MDHETQTQKNGRDDKTNLRVHMRASSSPRTPQEVFPLLPQREALGMIARSPRPEGTKILAPILPRRCEGATFAFMRKDWKLLTLEKTHDESPARDYLQARRLRYRAVLESIGAVPAVQRNVDLELVTPWLYAKSDGTEEGDSAVGRDCLHLLRDAIVQRLDSGENDIFLKVPEDIVKNVDPINPRLKLTDLL